MGPEVLAAVDEELSSGKAPRSRQKSNSFLNSTLGSADDVSSENFALKISDSPARTRIHAYEDDEMCADGEIDEKDVSLRSLGLDFV